MDATGRSESKEEEEEERIERKWWDKVLDKKEAKEQMIFALPMILTNVFYFFIPLASVMFAGHLGHLELAGATLANSWASATGFAFMVGLSGALETLCGQGYGAKLFSSMGIHLQASCITSLIFSIIISVFWNYTEPMLVLVRQDREISHAAGVYIRLMIPSVFAYGFIQNIQRYLQTQSVVRPLVVFSGVPLLAHLAICYCFVHHTPLGYMGAPLACSISLWLSFLMLASYVLFSKRFHQTWTGFSTNSFRYLFKNFKFAIPSAAMVCLEYWAFEIMVFLAGLMPNSQVTTSLIAICVNTQAIAFMLISGLSAATSTRVSNNLGAGHSEKAKNAMFVSLKLSAVLAMIAVTGLGFGHNIWIGAFSNSPDINHAFASITPLLLISMMLDSFLGILSGVARGCGWQHIAVYVNLAMFYFVGMTVAALLAFKAKIYVKGLWIGMICGLACQVATLMVITMRTKWTKWKLNESREEIEEDPIPV